MKKHWVIFSVACTLAVVAGSFWAYTVFKGSQKTQQGIASPPSADANNPAPPPAPSYVDQVISAMSLRDKVASLFILHSPGTNLSPYASTHKPGGLIFMSDNIPATLTDLQAQTRALITDAKLPPLLAIDEEGDTVKRLAADTYPGALTLPDLPPAATKDAFSKRSELLKSVGLNLNFGIIADVSANPRSFIFPRVLGKTPQAASERVAEAVAGSKGKTLSTLKHFPGHGETTANSHTSIPITTTGYADWQQRVSLPFKAGIDAGADCVMFGHLRYNTVDSQPATLSKKWHDIIRNELGFKGIIITDDMIMLQSSGDQAYNDPVENAVAALQAGNDLLLYILNHAGGVSAIDTTSLIDGVTAAANNGRLNKTTIDDAAHKVLTVRHQLAAL